MRTNTPNIIATNLRTTMCVAYTIYTIRADLTKQKCDLENMSPTTLRNVFVGGHKITRYAHHTIAILPRNVARIQCIRRCTALCGQHRASRASLVKLHNLSAHHVAAPVIAVVRSLRRTINWRLSRQINARFTHTTTKQCYRISYGYVCIHGMSFQSFRE